MKRILILALLCMALPCMAQKVTNVPRVEGDILHSIQNEWVVADFDDASGQPTDLSVTERTKLKVDALIIADGSDDGEISVFKIPSKWNAMKFRASGQSLAGHYIAQIYFGTIGEGNDCVLSKEAELDWTIGSQVSMRTETIFTSGGTIIPKAGDLVTGVSTGATATVTRYVLGGGSWAAGTADGVIQYKSQNKAFGNIEKVSITRGGEVITIDAYTHGGNDTDPYLLASAVSATFVAWSEGTTWKTVSPTGAAQIAEAIVDVRGADIMVVIATTAGDASKLLVTGY